MKNIAVIMAGGRGTRLWPLSRKNKPKQFCALVSDKTMLQETYERLLPIFDIADIYVATNKDYVQIIKDQLPDISYDNIISEPELRDTVGGIALVLAVISARNPDATIMTFPADHVVANPSVLYDAVHSAESFLSAESFHDYIVTFGIRPTSPETGFGYIQRGELLSADLQPAVYLVNRFVEKPDLQTAQKYLAEGIYEWNAGMFAFSAQSMKERFHKYIPDTYQRLVDIYNAVDTAQYQNVLQREFAQIEKVSIDYAILEKDQKIAVIPIELQWDDVGSWSALKDLLADSQESNVFHGDHIDMNSKNLLVYGSDKPVVTVGLENVIVVQTDDVTLVCDKSATQDISSLVKRLIVDNKNTLI